jgi:acyl dehydratase
MDPRERWFEDYREGETIAFGDRTVTAEEIIAFAREYDPQSFHLSEEGGRATPYGVLVDHVLSRHGLGSPGLDELRWSAPVRPGDRLRWQVTVLEARRSRSKPDRGIVRQKVEAYNQNGEQVLSWTAAGLVRCRTPAPDAAG